MKYTFLFLIVFNLALPSKGQESLSLTDAVKLGLERNYDIIIEQKNVETAAVDNVWSNAGILPTVNLTAGQNNNFQNNVRVAFPTSTRGKTQSNNILPGVNVSWTLSNGIVANIANSRLAQLQEQSEGNAEVVVSNTVQAIVLGYYVAVLENERLAQFEAQLKLSRDRFEFRKITSELGTTGTSDLLLEQGNYLTDSINFINQGTVYANAVRNLNFLLGEEDISKTYRFTDALQQDFSISSEEALLSSITENKDLKSIYLQQAIFRTNTRAARAERIPTVTLNAGYNSNRQSLNLSEAVFFTGDGFSSGPEDPLNSVTNSTFVNFNLTFTLFDGGRINRSIKRNIIQEDLGNIRIDRMKLSISRDVRNAYRIYQDRQTLLNINIAREEIAARNLEINEERYKVGTVNSFDYRAIQNNYLSASIQKLQALYNLIDSKVTLLRLSGGLMSEYGQ